MAQICGHPFTEEDSELSDINVEDELHYNIWCAEVALKTSDTESHGL